VTTTVTLKLDDRESDALSDMTRRTGQSPEELLGDVVRRFLATPGQSDWRAAWHQAAGLWKGRTDLPPLAELRGEWERPTAEGRECPSDS
jgi:hypothetical protein